MQKFFAKLKGKNEVPDPVFTEAFGVAKFVTNRRGNKIKFFLEVELLDNFVQAHIHFGGKRENGPVLAFLFGADVATLTEQNGITTRRGVVTGVIKDEDIEDNDLGVKCVEDLLELMTKGLTYVNVHTEQNPAGEIRGQIMPLYQDRY
ncbi:CHRD domain-containing protein [Halobacillus yeomjeoni]|uniref:CHRD domain-containing protein n=1 Tax=Halobacillus yeomjeoni TaxID=311194 RepID=UPI001CD707C9|nr:CHRD domain-containing protein [Halobacillus yeomjeoni]MCA0984212.1 CHRD domain-containing protein [Halobacillus yeomjeoni]